jgi:hypothetical protein
MSQLSFNLRAHDLPPSWDGVPVEWGEWAEMVEPFICPPPKDPRCCPQCGSTKTPNRARGKRVVPFGDNVVRLGRARLRPREHRAPDLVALRCPACEHDTVWDMVTNEWWDLDDSDYLDGGSWEAGT